MVLACERTDTKASARFWRLRFSCANIADMSLSNNQRKQYRSCITASSYASKYGIRGSKPTMSETRPNETLLNSASLSSISNFEAPFQKIKNKKSKHQKQYFDVSSTQRFSCVLIHRPSQSFAGYKSGNVGSSNTDRVSRFRVPALAC